MKICKHLCERTVQVGFKQFCFNCKIYSEKERSVSKRIYVNRCHCLIRRTYTPKNLDGIVEERFNLIFLLINGIDSILLLKAFHVLHLKRNSSSFLVCTAFQVHESQLHVPKFTQQICTDIFVKHRNVLTDKVLPWGYRLEYRRLNKSRNVVLDDLALSGEELLSQKRKSLWFEYLCS